MNQIILRQLARELDDLYMNEHTVQRPKVRFLHVLKWEYRPEDMSDCENQVVWTRLILLSLRHGVTTVDYEQELGVIPMELQQWANGVSMPLRTQMRKDLYCAITALVRTKQNTS